MLQAGAQRSRRSRIALRSLPAAAIAFAVLVAAAAPAWAHTELESSSPAAGASVTALRTVELRFSEGIEAGASRVSIGDAAGTMELGPASLLDRARTSLSVPVPALGDGTYEVAWHVVAGDGAPAHGAFSVTVASPHARAPALPITSVDPAADPPPDASFAVPLAEPTAPPVSSRVSEHGHGSGDLTNAVARGVLDASLSTLVGGLAFIAAVWPQGAQLVRTRRMLWLAALLAALASFELVAFQHAAGSGLSTARALFPGHQWDALQFRFGQIAAARVGLLVLGAVLTARLRRSAGTPRSTGWCMAACVTGLGLAETVVLLGHSSAPGAVAAAARLVHVLGISVWIGGLVTLLCVVVPRRRVDELVAVLPRFSALATGAVATLTAGGLVLAVDLVGTVGALPSTGYGRVLLAKTAVVGVLLLVASRSRRHVRSCLRAPDRLATDAVVGPLALWVGTELCLMTAVLGLTSVLVSRGPPG